MIEEIKIPGENGDEIGIEEEFNIFFQEIKI